VLPLSIGTLPERSKAAGGSKVNAFKVGADGGLRIIRIG
jgi:hypothetical protein